MKNWNAKFFISDKGGSFNNIFALEKMTPFLAGKSVL